jgi:hypothetical protein
VSFLMVFLIIIYFPTLFMSKFSISFFHQFCISILFFKQNLNSMQMNLINPIVELELEFIIVKFLKNLINNLPFFKSIYMFNHFPLHMKKN